MDKSKSKSVYISVNTSEVKDANNEIVNTSKVKYARNKTKDEEPWVTDNSIINAPSCFKLFKCSKNVLNKIDASCEQACMENSKDKYYMELCNTITDYYDCNNTPLSNMNIHEAILQVMREEEEATITDANNITAYTFGLAFSPHREN